MAYDSTPLFVEPQEPTWAAHAELIKNPRNRLQFNPDAHRDFDRVVAETAGLRGLYDPADAAYALYEGLRTNVAVLRNFILNRYAQSRDDPAEKLRSIADAIGEALGNDTWVSRPFTVSMSVDVANVEGVGAAEIYKHLLRIQETPALAQPLIRRVKKWLHIPDRTWGLPPLEDTPFSPERLAAPPGGPSSPLPLPPTPPNDSAPRNERAR